MSEKTDLIYVIYAPSLYWFAYRYREGLVISLEPSQPQSLETPVDPQWVEEEYKKILAAFDIELEFAIRTDEPGGDFDLLANTGEAGDEESDFEGDRQYAYFTSKDEELEGLIYPQSLHDSYALNLNIFYPENRGKDECQIADLAKLNPNNCFQPPSEPPSGYAGQTLLLSCYLSGTRPENIRELDRLAKKCWLAFFQLEPADAEQKGFPPLYRAVDFLGGYLYEYGDPRSKACPYGRLLIWFFFDDAPSLVLEKCYWQLPELLLYYHKIAKTFQDSRDFYAKADGILKDSERELNDFNQTYANREAAATLSGLDLEILKSTLKKLLQTSLAYSQQLRNLRYARNTIAINTKNYQATLEGMEQLAETPLEALRLFAAKEATAFQDQIEADLNYFQQGSSLLDTAIATIRGLVEIDQAQRDRQIQDQFQAIGLAIAGGAIVASTASLIYQEPIALPWQKESGDRLHPFTFSVLLSFACAFGLWLAFWLFSKWLPNIFRKKR